MVENVVLSLVPTPAIMGIIATAIPAAIRPYSIAVAAPSSFQNFKIRAVSHTLSHLQSWTVRMSVNFRSFSLFTSLVAIADIRCFLFDHLVADFLVFC